MRSNIKFLSLAFSLFITFAGCQKLFIDPNPEGSAERNFEIFWSDLNNSYPYFKKDKVNWSETYAKYRPRVTESTSQKELAQIFIEMLEPLSDQHIKLKTSFLEWPYSSPDYPINYDPSTINEIYLDNAQKYILAPNFLKPEKIDTVGKHGVINNGEFIYFRAGTFLTEHPFQRTLDSLINRYPNAKGIILDVRFNGGGFIASMIELLGTFTNLPENRAIKYAFNKEKVGPLDESFGPSRYFPMFSNGYDTYTKPVALLTNRYSYSAAEHAALAMKEIPTGIVIGDTTGGALSPILERTLPNGFEYTVVNSITTDRFGRIYEKAGVPPDITVMITSPGRDDIIEKAIMEINAKSNNFQ